MTDRAIAIRDLLARAVVGGRAVYGFDGQRASCERLPPKKDIPEGWDWICVEGDERWTHIGTETEAKGSE